MQAPASPLYAVSHDEQFGFSPSPTHKKSYSSNGTGNKIDYSKFKTKMCRNFLTGNTCPFEDRCAFSHGEASAERMAKIQNMYLASHDAEADDSTSSTGSLVSPKRQGLPPRGLYVTGTANDAKHGSYDNFLSSNSSTGDNSYSSFNPNATTSPSAGHNAKGSDFLPPPPPSYEVAITEIAYGGAAVSPYSVSDKEAAAMPPAYPTRYRHDPYSFAGIIYE